MKRIILITLSILLTSNLFSQEASEKLYLKAWNKFNKGQYQKAAQFFEESIVAGHNWNGVYLNAASAWAYVDNKEKVFENLNKLVEANYLDKKYILTWFSEFYIYKESYEWEQFITKMDTKRERFYDFAKNADFQELTKDQMYQDYDTLVSNLLRYSPHLKVQQNVCGLKLNFDKYRESIKSCGSSQNFALLIKKTVINCQDGHTGLVSLNPFQYLSQGKDSSFCASIHKYQEYYNLFVTQEENLPKLVYYNGSYYVADDYFYKEVFIPNKAELVKVAGIEPSKFIQENIANISFLAWDFDAQCYYSEYFLHRSITTDSILELTFSIENKSVNVLVELTKGRSINKISKTDNGTVSYWEDEYILYIRMPKMVNAMDYVDKIQAYRNKEIKKVILDIRYNSGGSDYEWEDVLSSIFPLKHKLQIHFAFNKGYREKGKTVSIYNKYSELDLVYISKKVPIGNRKISNIGFKGKIYVLYNGYSYSAAGSLVNTCYQLDNLVAVGHPTGRILGFGTTPKVFSLPNTKIKVRLNPLLDVTNVENYQDLFHDKPEIEIVLSLEEKILLENSSKSEEFVLLSSERDFEKQPFTLRK